ncbi:kinesin-related protein 11 [Umbelopsis sp. PMI_123]|nr:kinesin-related protein 11 [Umbelopsis sp. PMI_123]
MSVKLGSMPHPSRQVSTTSTHSKTKNHSSENVQVAVRCRPMSASEARVQRQVCWDINTTLNSIVIAEGYERQNRERHIYHYDRVVYGSDNFRIYDNNVAKLVNSTMEGYNGTVFAYGQTASGKTYTMVGTHNEPGVIPRAVNDVFEYIKANSTREFLLRVSYLEIYNEAIHDLLSPGTQDLKIHEDKQRGVYVSPLKEEVLTNAKQALKVIQKGEENRHVSTTNYNLHSSRSHTIFRMIIESKEREPNASSQTQRDQSRPSNTKSTVKISQLNLIDLAGSEKATANLERQKEGAFINKSLLTLGTVISKLTDSKGASHIPFRDSKLTRILQPSLSGNAKVAVICTVSPVLTNMEESINTLKFAERVKLVVTAAKANEILDDKALLQQYRNEITTLKARLEQGNDLLAQQQKVSENIMQAEKRKHEEQMRDMDLVRTALKERINHLTKLILTSSSSTSFTKMILTPSNLGDYSKRKIDSDDSLPDTLRVHSNEAAQRDGMDDVSQKLAQATINSNETSSGFSVKEFVQLKAENENLKQEVRQLQAQAKQNQMKIQTLEQQLRLGYLQPEAGVLNSNNDQDQLIASLQAELSIVKGESMNVVTFYF